MRGLPLAPFACCAVIALAVSHARADGPPQPMAAITAERPIFEYTTPQAPDYLRAVLEEAAFLGMGFAQYAANHDLNSVDWDFTYTWSGLHDKLGPHGYSFDTNGFDTNFTRHPFAGTGYYWAARANRLTVLESLAAATIASTLWEYLGELRERASLNDLWVTPLSGMVLGELTVQLGLLFDRSCDNIPNRVLGTVLSPLKTVNDVLDAARLLRETQCDRYQLSRRGEHAFELSMTAGALNTVAGPHVPARLESRLELHTQITALEKYGLPGNGGQHFDDGNISELWLRSSFAGDLWNDFTIRAAIMPFGLHQRAIDEQRHGYELVFGLLTMTEYSVHRFGEWNALSELRDRFFEIDMPGVSLGYRRLWGDLVLALELQACAAFVGVDALALPQYHELSNPRELTSIARTDGYNYAIGVRLLPRARLTYRWFVLGLELSALRVRAVTIDDRYTSHAPLAPDNERRTIATAWVNVGPEHWPVRLTLQAEWYERWGELDAARAQRAELSTRAGITALF